MKVIIAGTRTFNDDKLLRRTVDQIFYGRESKLTEIVSGGAKGADRLGERYAKDMSMPLRVFKANWTAWGNRAGPKRNQQMAEYADMLIAFWDGHSKGTQDMIQRAQVNGLEVWIRLYI